MHVLIAYWVVGNAIEEFKRTQIVQRQFSDIYARYKKVLITDYTGPLEVDFPVIRRTDLLNGKRLRLNVARNACLDHALATGADWIILADADMVVTNWPTQWPKSGYAAASQHHAPEAILDFPAETLANLSYGPSSYYLIHRDVFSVHRFFEGLEGYGYNDTDYYWSILWFAGIEKGLTDLRLIHVWHPRRAADRHAQTERSRKVFAKRVAIAARRTGIEPAWHEIDEKSRRYITQEMARIKAPPAARERLIRPQSLALPASDSPSPLATAVMITGKSQERTPLAHVAIKCFLAQDYPNKELLILNDGEQPLGIVHPLIREVMLPPSARRSLGELRNLAFDHANGEWLVQWDDDDWHAPGRMTVQMNARMDGAATFLRRQIRYSFVTGSTIVVGLNEGIHGTILHERGVPHRYPPLGRGEDTQFMRSFKRHVVIDNDPAMYVRFHHGLNTWSGLHIMKWNDNELDRCQITARDQRRLAREVLPCYATFLTQIER